MLKENTKDSKFIPPFFNTIRKFSVTYEVPDRVERELLSINI